MSGRNRKGERISLGDSSAVPVDSVIEGHLREGFPLSAHRLKIGVETQVRFMGSVAESDLQSAEDLSPADLNNSLWVSGEYKAPSATEYDADEAGEVAEVETLAGFHESEPSNEVEENAKFEQETAALLMQCTHRG